ncbi:hypothetical protein RSOLAG22IIIB_13044 [Rhizoctonia solani]|uniref:Uncharacterized protein n=1 Tax=Rhizoctonia solani TaxID=456999 RepID=A0A0K6GIR6_9AGAM|nr:hypothetical protein RSOLAG22IIIB_13044 [Rhizoctonia solani]
MAPLLSGLYNLQIRDSDTPEGFIGGEYATARAPGETVFLQPESIKGQVWNVTIEREVEGGYIINLQAKDINADESRTYLHNERNEPQVPLILSGRKAFKAQHEKYIGQIGIYSLLPTDIEPGPVGVTLYVGRGRGNEVALQAVPVVEHPPPHPVWAFTPLHKD